MEWSNLNKVISVEDSDYDKNTDKKCNEKSTNKTKIMKDYKKIK